MGNKQIIEEKELWVPPVENLGEKVSGGGTEVGGFGNLHRDHPCAAGKHHVEDERQGLLDVATLARLTRRSRLRRVVFDAVVLGC